MGIWNRRNAFLGWLVWQLGKRVAARKVKSLVPGGRGGGAASRLAVVLGGLAAVGGALWLWLGRDDDGDDDGE